MAPATSNGWTNLTKWLRSEGVEGRYDEPEWDDGPYRLEHLEEFDATFIPWVTSKTKAELTAGARERHLAIGPSRTVDEILEDDHLAARDYWAEVEAPSGGARYRLPGVPFRMSETPLRAGGRAPRLGEHTEELLAESARTPGGRIVDGAGSPSTALEGLRVIDFSWFGAGPMATIVLANHGAEVIRIESEYRLDGLRRAGPMPLDRSGPNLSGYYNNHNSSKLSVKLNVNDETARDLVRRLIATADVVIDNFNPGVMERWGFTHEQLRKLREDIIVINMPMNGLSGPRRDEVGFGSTLTGICGLNQLPVGLGTNYPDYSCNPYHAISAVLAALHHRRRSGRGQHIELAQVESTLQLLGPAMLERTVAGREPRRLGNRDPLAAPHGLFRAAGPPTSAGEDDRWIAIACMDDGQWRALVEVMGEPGWAVAPALATLEGRQANVDELERQIGEWVRTQDAYELMDRLQRRGVPSGVVQDAGDCLDRDPQFRARRHFQRLQHPEAGETAYDAPPVTLSLTPGALRGPAPCLGEHTRRVLTSILGVSEEELGEYEEAGVFF